MGPVYGAARRATTAAKTAAIFPAAARGGSRFHSEKVAEAFDND